MSSQRILRRLEGERAIALVMAVGVMSAMSLVVTFVIYFAATNSSSASRQGADQQAFSLGEAGLTNAVSALMNAADPTSLSAVPTAATPGTDTVTFPGATVSWWGTYDAGTTTWTLYGKGTVPAPTSDALVDHIVSQQALVSVGNTTLVDNPSWNYIFTDNKDGACMPLSSSVQIAEPLYVTGDLCLSSSAQVLGAAGVVTARSIQTESSSKIGSSGSPLATLHVAQGCRYGTTGPFVTPCTTSHRIWTTAQDTNTGNLSKPSVDLAGWYANAKPGPMHSCTSGSFPGGFDNDAVMNGSRAAVDLLPASSYDCVFTVGAQTVGRIRWDASALDFEIQGAVFFDGSIWMSGSEKVDYTGRGTIYANGSIFLGSSMQFCAERNAGNCDFGVGAWDPEEKLLVLVAATSVDLISSVQFQGAIWAGTSYTQGSSVKSQGPIIATSQTWFSSSQAKWSPFTTLPPGTPGTPATGIVELLPGTWRG